MSTAQASIKSTLSARALAFSIDALISEKDGKCDTKRKVADEIIDSSVESSEKRPRVDQVKEEVSVRLHGKDLWKRFSQLGTEMLVTKAGRRMSPTIHLSVSGVSEHVSYHVIVDIIPVDKKRYRYSFPQSCWIVAGDGDTSPPKRVYVHPGSPFTGRQLLKEGVSFEKLKMTNNLNDTNGYIILNSMHKYQPQVHIIPVIPDTPCTTPDSLGQKDKLTFTFPETVFIAVTTYHNHLVSQLKIDSNPFAKGIREQFCFLPMCDSGHSSFKRSHLAQLNRSRQASLQRSESFTWPSKHGTRNSSEAFYPTMVVNNTSSHLQNNYLPALYPLRLDQVSLPTRPSLLEVLTPEKQRGYHLCETPFSVNPYHRV